MDKEILISSLIEKGWYSLSGSFSKDFCAQLVEDMSHTPMKQASIGKGNRQQLNLDIRNDSIAWLDENTATSAQKCYLQEMEQIRGAINRELYLGLKSFECHYAHYTSGGFYKKHLDQHAQSKQRIVTFITYLNPPQSGGDLIIFKRYVPDVVEATVKPETGTIVCFLSDQIYHEVLKTNDDRYSLTGWFRNDQP